jgi:hypothetical protein
MNEWKIALSFTPIPLEIDLLLSSRFLRNFKGEILFKLPLNYFIGKSHQISDALNALEIHL